MIKSEAIILFCWMPDRCQGKVASWIDLEMLIEGMRPHLTQGSLRKFFCSTILFSSWLLKLYFSEKNQKKKKVPFSVINCYQPFLQWGQSCKSQRKWGWFRTPIPIVSVVEHSWWGGGGAVSLRENPVFSVQFERETQAHILHLLVKRPSLQTMEDFRGSSLSFCQLYLFSIPNTYIEISLLNVSGRSCG